MTMQYQTPTVSEALPLILSDLLEYGAEVGSRNGRVKELLNPQIVITDPTRREVLSLNRKANVFAQIAETMWVISGRNDIEWLGAYLPRAKDYSDDGEVWRGGYGPRIRNWKASPEASTTVDQLAYVVETLWKDPLSRQAVIAIYHPGEDTQPGLDRPCNTFLQFQSREGRLDLTVTVRSNDVMWGWSGINAFEWSTLQEIVASLLNISVGHLVFNIGSLHLYDQHWAKAHSIEYERVTYPRTPFDSEGRVTTLDEVDRLISRWFEWENKCRTGEVTLGQLDTIPEALFRSWAAAIAYYWTQDEMWLEPLKGTALAVAIARTPKSVYPQPVTPRSQSRSTLPVVRGTRPAPERLQAFHTFVTDLHAAKSKSYGNSWKKRGEKISILANIARKVDRLGVGDQFDSEADTVIDLLVYLIKYLGWLKGNDELPDWVDSVLAAALPRTKNRMPEHGWKHNIPLDLNLYIDTVDDKALEAKISMVQEFINRVTPIAFEKWYVENEYRGADAD